MKTKSEPLGVVVDSLLRGFKGSLVVLGLYYIAWPLLMFAHWFVSVMPNFILADYRPAYPMLKNLNAKWSFIPSLNLILVVILPPLYCYLRGIQQVRRQREEAEEAAADGEKTSK